MEFTNSQKWQDKLHTCIRCGYCFEHCHIFKITGWETDTPRGKLILIHEMLQGNLEPNEYIAEKIFECYSCKRCDTTCSAKVEVTEIFNDAKTDLLQAGFDVEGTMSATDDDFCCRCQICVSVCKHEARSLDKEENKIVVDKIKCQSCGCCIAACPSGAAYGKEGFGLTEKEFSEEIIRYLEEGEAV